MNNNNYYDALLLLIPHLVKPQCASLSRKQPQIRWEGRGGGGGDTKTYPLKALWVESLFWMLIL